MKVVSSQWPVGSKAVLRRALCAMLFALCSSAEAQQPAKIFKIGYLSVQTDARGSRGGSRQLVRQHLHALGYVDGKNIIFEYRYADNKLDRLPGLADEIVRHKVDLILASSNPAALAAKNATKTIPIVFLGAGDPVALVLVDSLARPGENITGITSIAEVLAGKRRDSQGNHSQALPPRRTVESAESRLCATVERKPIGGARLGSADSLHGSEQRRQTRQRIQ